MNTRIKLALACAALTLASCTTAGPFVTSISSDGAGNLIIEKSMVKMNAFMGTVSNTDTTTQTIRITPLVGAGQEAPAPR